MAVIGASNRIRSRKDNEENAIYKDLIGISSDEKVVDDSALSNADGAESNADGVKRKGESDPDERPPSKREKVALLRSAAKGLRLRLTGGSRISKIDEEAALEFCPTSEDGELLCDCFNHGQFCYKGDPLLASLMDSKCNSEGEFDNAHWFPQIFMRNQYGGTKVNSR
jgi:hypothetical protein